MVLGSKSAFARRVRRKTGKTYSIILIATAAAAFGIYWSQTCHCDAGFRQERDRALAEATKRLQRFSGSFVTGSSLPTLVEEIYDTNKNWWMFTFKNDTCAVVLIVDCCGETDIGGTSGCPPR